MTIAAAVYWDEAEAHDLKLFLQPRSSAGVSASVLSAGRQLPCFPDQPADASCMFGSRSVTSLLSWKICRVGSVKFSRIISDPHSGLSDFKVWL